MESLSYFFSSGFADRLAFLSGQHRKVTRWICLGVLLVLVVSPWCQIAEVGAANPMLDERQACTRQASRWSCILGCFKCAETYGRKVYDMASCCAACQATKAVLIDDGPSVCSMQFFTGVEKAMNSYNSVKRYGAQTGTTSVEGGEY